MEASLNRAIVLTVAVLLAFLAAGCGGGGSSSSPTPSPAVSETPSQTSVPSPPVESIVDAATRWQAGVYLISLSSGEATRLEGAVQVPTPRGWPAATYALSRDGSRVALVHDKLSPDSVLRVTIYDLVGGGRTQVSLDPLTTAEGLSWSPDGTRLAVTGSGRVLLLDPNTGRRSTLFAEPGDEVSPWGAAAWAPDGESLLVLTYSGGNDRYVTVLGLDGVVRAELGTGWSAAWSPDGGEIAIGRSGGVYVVAANGSIPAQRLAKGGEPEWSPDGALLAYSRRDDSGEMSTYTIKRDGGGERRVARGASPVWSPDGSRIALLRDGNVFVVDADGGNEVQVTASPLPFLARLTWSQDGDTLAVVYEPGIDTMIYVAGEDGAGEIPLAVGSGPAWSPDGSRIAFSSGTAYTGYWGYIYVMDPDGSGITRIAPFGLSDAIPSCYGGALFMWSPDGRWIAYHGGRAHLVEATGGSQPIELGTGFGPVWSPNGDRIALTDRGEAAECAIYTVDPDDPAQRQLLFDDARLPAWSPDGTKIAFLRQVYSTDKNTTLEIYIGAVRGGSPKRIARFELDAYANPFSPPPAWSPDGSLIAVGLGGVIYILDPGGRADPIKLAAGDSPAWLPDGRHVAFSRYSEGRSHVYITDVEDSSEPRQLVEANSVSWSPDGGRIAFAR